MLKRRTLFAVRVLFVCTMLFPYPTTAQLSEGELRASYIFNFLKFITFPDTIFSSSSSPLLVCGKVIPEYGQQLEALKGREIKGRSVDYKSVSDFSSKGLQPCQVLVIDGSIQETALLEQLQGTPLLTIGDDDQSAIIQFILKEGKLRFVIHEDVAKEGGIEISSQLLKLAVR